MPRGEDREIAEYERARFIGAVLYMLAPRAGELESHRMNSFREERGRWWWHVVGKGGKKAKVPVAVDMLQALVRYRKFLGLTAVPKRSELTPILVSLKDGSPITARRLNQILKRIFSSAADLLPPASEYKREKLRSASAHWGRHTGITAKIDSGITERYVQKDARHSDARTTQRYIAGMTRRKSSICLGKRRLPDLGESVCAQFYLDGLTHFYFAGWMDLLGSAYARVAYFT
jgi:integrase